MGDHSSLNVWIKNQTMFSTGCVQFTRLFRSLEQPSWKSARPNTERTCVLSSQQCNTRWVEHGFNWTLWTFEAVFVLGFLEGKMLFYILQKLKLFWNMETFPSISSIPDEMDSDGINKNTVLWDAPGEVRKRDIFVCVLCKHFWTEPRIPRLPRCWKCRHKGLPGDERAPCRHQALE